MSTPTIDERCAAQAAAGYGLHPEVLAREMPNLMTPDELRAVLVELEQLKGRNEFLESANAGYRKTLFEEQRQRDQWRDLCTTFAHLRRNGDYGGSFSALARFDALVKEEKP